MKRKEARDFLLLHGRALLVRFGEGGSRGSNSSQILGVMEAEQLDAVQRIEIAIPCSEDLDILWAREIRDFYQP